MASHPPEPTTFGALGTQCGLTRDELGSALRELVATKIVTRWSKIGKNGRGIWLLLVHT